MVIFLYLFLSKIVVEPLSSCREAPVWLPRSPCLVAVEPLGTGAQVDDHCSNRLLLFKFYLRKAHRLPLLSFVIPLLSVF